MKRIFIAGMLSLVAAASAFAADLPPSPPPRAPVAYVPVVVPVYNWGGIYFGVNGGWGFGKAKWTANAIGGFPGISSSVSDNGGIVGPTLGVNWQAGALVFGVEGDWDYSGINTGTTATICTFSGTCQTGNNWLATLRGRVGYAVDRVLFYGTGGGVFGNAQTTFNGVQTTHTQAGWTAGLGVEVAFAQNWTAKVEYLYANLGTGNLNCSTLACTTLSGAPAIPVSVGLTDNLIRAGVNYKFNF
jgi:outer membrane immunogenic protein